MHENRVYRVDFDKESGTQGSKRLYEVQVYRFADYQRQKREIREFVGRAGRLLLRVALSAAAAAPAEWWMIGYAFQERGYRAFGGEHLLAAWVFSVVFQCLGRWLKKE